MRVLFTTMRMGPAFNFGFGDDKNARPIMISIPLLDLRGQIDMNNTKYY